MDMCTQGNTTPLKKNEIMPFAARWMELETLILSEVSQKEEDKYHMMSLIIGIYYTAQMIISTEKRIIHLEDKFVLTKQRGREWEGSGAWG